MIFRWPLVRANQRIVPLDFARLTAAAEDVIAHIAQHALADKTDAATATTATAATEGDVEGGWGGGMGV